MKQTVGRSIDPRTSVTSSLDKRRGFVQQADIREAQAAIARLDSVGDSPESVDGNFTVNGDFSVTGGDLYLGNATTRTLHLTGHINTKGSGLSVAVGANAASGGGSAASLVFGNDTAGQISITTGATATAGSFADLTFFVVRASTSYVLILTPANAAAAQLNWYHQASANTTTGCQIRSQSAPAASTVYLFNYVLLE